MNGLKKHIGHLSNTGTRIAVIFRKLPNDEKNALVCFTESLPDSYHDELINVINSQAAQSTTELSTVLNGRTFPDGTNCLSSLHQRGYLKKIPVSNITMTPLSGQKVPLALINASIDKKMDEYRKEEADKLIDESEAKNIPQPESDPVAIAHGLLFEADALEKTALEKREEAYSLVPDLRPKVGRPALTEEERILALEDRKEKRRIREQSKNTPEIKAEREKEIQKLSLEEKVQNKLKRDAVRKESVNLSHVDDE